VQQNASTQLASSTKYYAAVEAPIIQKVYSDRRMALVRLNGYLIFSKSV